jgi:hypothetical protein
MMDLIKRYTGLYFVEILEVCIIGNNTSICRLPPVARWIHGFEAHQSAGHFESLNFSHIFNFLNQITV